MKTNTYVVADTVAEIKALTTRPSLIQLDDGINPGIFNWSTSVVTGDDLFVIVPTSGPAGHYARVGIPDSYMNADNSGDGSVNIFKSTNITNSIAATGSHFLNAIEATVTTGDGTGDIGGTSFLYTATATSTTVQLRNAAFQTIINHAAGNTAALAVAVDAFITLGPTGGSETGPLTAAVVHRAHYSNKSTNASPQEITTAYTYWAAGVDVNDAGATGTVKTNAALNISDQGDTSQFPLIRGVDTTTKSKVYRDTHGVLVRDFTEGSITAAAFSSEMTGAVIVTAATVTSSSTTMSVGSVSGGLLFPQQTVVGTGIPSDTQIVQQLTGTPGGAGTYQLSRTPASDIVSPITISAQTTKVNLNFTGNAPSIHDGALRIGSTSLPQVNTLDAGHAYGASLPNETTNDSQFVAQFTEALGSSAALNTILIRTIAAGTSTVSTLSATVNQVDLNKTGGTTALAYGTRSIINITPGSGTSTVTSARNMSANFSFGGAGNSRTTLATGFDLEAVTFSGAGAHTVTGLTGFFVRDVGNSSIGTLIGFDMSAQTTVASTTAGFRSQLPSASGVWNFLASGTANNAFAGSTRFGSNVAPISTVDITGTMSVSGVVTAASTVIIGTSSTALLTMASVSSVYSGSTARIDSASLQAFDTFQNFGITTTNQGARLQFTFGTGGASGANAGFIDIVSTDTWAAATQRSTKFRAQVQQGGGGMANAFEATTTVLSLPGQLVATTGSFTGALTTAGNFIATTATVTGATTLSSTVSLGGNAMNVSGTVNYCGGTSGADVYVATATPAITTYATGSTYYVKVNSANTTTNPTINFNSVAAKTIVKRAATALAGGDLAANGFYQLIYNGSAFQVMNPTVP